MTIVEGVFDTKARLVQLERDDMPFAAMLYLNDVAAGLKGAGDSRVLQAFDNPTSFTRKAVYSTRASKAKLTVEVGIKAAQRKYLLPNEQGGGRRFKGFEGQLMGAGLLKRGEYVVPPSGKTVTKSMMKKVLAQASTIGPTSSTRRFSGKKKSRASVFYITRRDSFSAIWRRNGRKSVVLFFITTVKPNYDPVFDFEGALVSEFLFNHSARADKAIRRAIFSGRRR